MGRCNKLSACRGGTRAGAFAWVFQTAEHSLSRPGPPGMPVLSDVATNGDTAHKNACATFCGIR